MAHNLAESPTRAQPVQVPDPADARTAASVIAGMQPLANRLAYVEAKAMGLSAGTTFDVSAVDFVGAKLDSSSAGTFTYFAHTWLQDGISAAPKLEMNIRIPTGSIITGAVAYVRGSFSGSHSGLPAIMPALTLYQTQPQISSGGTQLVVNTATQVDTSGSVGAYDTDHTITISGLTWTIGQGHMALARLTGEAGSGSIANHFMLYGVAIAYTNF